MNNSVLLDEYFCITGRIILYYWTNFCITGWISVLLDEFLYYWTNFCITGWISVLLDEFLYYWMNNPVLLDE